MTAESLLAQQNVLLQQLIDLLQQKQPLGFSEAPRPRYIYCNRSQNGLWYWLNDAREVVPIPQTALTCLIDKLEFKQVERRGKDTWKIHLHVRADRRYILEAGYDSNFSKSLLSALSVMTPQQLQQPITIELQAAEADGVLFCRVYANGELVFAPWDESTTWKVVAKRAIANVELASNGRLRNELNPAQSHLVESLN
jgi:phage pi2 protein 07